eukprot:7480713-Alexandrium_andersonii.AAC.1
MGLNILATVKLVPGKLPLPRPPAGGSCGARRPTHIAPQAMFSRFQAFSTASDHCLAPFVFVFLFARVFWYAGACRNKEHA